MLTFWVKKRCCVKDLDAEAIPPIFSSNPGISTLRHATGLAGD